MTNFDFNPGPNHYTRHLTAEQAIEQGYAETTEDHQRDATIDARYNAEVGTTLTHEDGRIATRRGDDWEITQPDGEHIAWVNGHGVVDFR